LILQSEIEKRGLNSSRATESAQREGQIAELHFRARQAEIWRSNVEAAARNAVAIRQQQALLADVERHLIPPPPRPEPEVVYVAGDRLGSPNYFDDNYNPNYYHDKFWGKSGK
jgi:hypothetical protein